MSPTPVPNGSSERVSVLSLNLVSELLQREIGTLATDLLIATAIASINLPLLRQKERGLFSLLLLL